MHPARILLFFSFVITTGLLPAQDLQPRPTKAQMQWHAMEFYLFMHFGPNTFTGLEWGYGNEKEEVFNPTDLDCEQWCRIAKSSGATSLALTGSSVPFHNH
jgi:alpha-L-fucosidase